MATSNGKQMKYLLKLGKANLHRYPVSQKFCRNPTSKFLFYEKKRFQKVLIYRYCSICDCVPYEPIFPILCLALFVKNSKIEYDPQFWGGEIFFFENWRLVCLHTLWVENFDKITLSRTVKEMQALLCFTR